MESFNISFEAIGTQWVIDCFNSSAKKEDIFKILVDRAEEFEKTYSRFRDDSLVWQISKKAGEYRFPEDSKIFLNTFDDFYKITDKKFTLLIGNTLTEAGYDANYSLKSREINKIPDSTSIYDWEYPILIVKKPYILDFGGLGKGYLIDIFSNLLKENGIDSFIVDGGGDMKVSNLKTPLRIGLENPNDIKQVIGVIEVDNSSIAASSGNRRKWGDYHHIIDPDLLKSPDHILATWVIAKDGLVADGLATSLFLVNPQKLLKYYDFEYFILKPDFTFDKSKKFNAELFLK